MVFHCCLLLQAHGDLERSRHALTDTNTSLQQQLAQLQQQAAEREAAQQESMELLKQDSQALAANLAALRQYEDSYRCACCA